MADGKGRDEWGRMSSLLAMLANIHRDPKKKRRPYTPVEFNPYHAPKRKRGHPVTVDRLAREIESLGKGRRKR